MTKNATNWTSMNDIFAAEENKLRAEREAHKNKSSPIPVDGLSSIDSPVIETGQVIETSQATKTRQAKPSTPDRPQTSQAIETGQVIETNHSLNSSNLMSALPDVKGHTRFYHQIVDHLYPMLDAYEQTAHFHLYRLSWGYNKPTCTISLQKLSERAGLSYKSAQRAVNNLERRGLVKWQGRIIGYGKEQGIEFWVAAAPSQVTEASQVTKTRQATEGYIKEKGFKRKDIKSDSLKFTRLTPEDRKETVEMIVGMIAGGSYTIEQAETQFGANLTAEDWTLVRAKASE